MTLTILAALAKLLRIRVSVTYKELTGNAELATAA